MNHKIILTIDAIVNLLLGLILILGVNQVLKLIGVVFDGSSFDQNILRGIFIIFGAVLFGIGIALSLECFNRPKKLVGLGIGGAVSINLCGGFALAGWLLFSGVTIPPFFQIGLWALVFILIIISLVELVVHFKATNKSA